MMKLERILAIQTYLCELDASAGIIESRKDRIIWRNPKSQDLMERWNLQYAEFEPPKYTHDLHPSASSLATLKKEVKRLKPIKELPSNYFLDKQYQLRFHGMATLEVVDRFYRLRVQDQWTLLPTEYRIWVNLRYEFI